jgi:hypothetical protein
MTGVNAKSIEVGYPITFVARNRMKPDHTACGVSRGRDVGRGRWWGHTAAAEAIGPELSDWEGADEGARPPGARPGLADQIGSSQQGGLAPSPRMIPLPLGAAHGPSLLSGACRAKEASRIPGSGEHRQLWPHCGAG